MLSSLALQTSPVDVAGALLIILFLLGVSGILQLAIVPIVASNRGRDGGIWFLVTVIWLFFNAGAIWVLLYVFQVITFVGLASGNSRGTAAGLLGFLMSLAIIYLPLLVLLLSPSKLSAGQPRLTWRTGLRRLPQLIRRRRIPARIESPAKAGCVPPGPGPWKAMEEAPAQPQGSGPPCPNCSQRLPIGRSDCPQCGQTIPRVPRRERPRTTVRRLRQPQLPKSIVIFAALLGGVIVLSAIVWRKKIAAPSVVVEPTPPIPPRTEEPRRPDPPPSVPPPSRPPALCRACDGQGKTTFEIDACSNCKMTSAEISSKNGRFGRVSYEGERFNLPRLDGLTSDKVLRFGVPPLPDRELEPQFKPVEGDVEWIAVYKSGSRVRIQGYEQKGQTYVMKLKGGGTNAIPVALIERFEKIEPPRADVKAPTSEELKRAALERLATRIRQRVHEYVQTNAFLAKGLTLKTSLIAPSDREATIEVISELGFSLEVREDLNLLIGSRGLLEGYLSRRPRSLEEAQRYGAPPDAPAGAMWLKPFGMSKQDPILVREKSHFGPNDLGAGMDGHAIHILVKPGCLEKIGAMGTAEREEDVVLAIDGRHVAQLPLAGLRELGEFRHTPNFAIEPQQYPAFMRSRSIAGAVLNHPLPVALEPLDVPIAGPKKWIHVHPENTSFPFVKTKREDPCVACKGSGKKAR